MRSRIFGLESEYGLIFSPNGRVYLPIEKVLGYIFEGLIPDSWPSNAFLVNGARFYQDTGCHPEYSTPNATISLILFVTTKRASVCLKTAFRLLRNVSGEEGLSGEIFIFKNNIDSHG
jgi:proteasome accessory factor A